MGDHVQLRGRPGRRRHAGHAGRLHVQDLHDRRRPGEGHQPLHRHQRPAAQGVHRLRGLQRRTPVGRLERRHRALAGLATPPRRATSTCSGVRPTRSTPSSPSWRSAPGCARRWRRPASWASSTPTGTTSTRSSPDGTTAEVASFTLGSTEISPLTLANAYATVGRPRRLLQAPRHHQDRRPRRQGAAGAGAEVRAGHHPQRRRRCGSGADQRRGRQHLRADRRPDDPGSGHDRQDRHHRQPRGGLVRRVHAGPGGGCLGRRPPRRLPVPPAEPDHQRPVLPAGLRLLASRTHVEEGDGGRAGRQRARPHGPEERVGPAACPPGRHALPAQPVRRARGPLVAAHVPGLRRHQPGPGPGQGQGQDQGRVRARASSPRRSLRPARPGPSPPAGRRRSALRSAASAPS